MDPLQVRWKKQTGKKKKRLTSLVVVEKRDLEVDVKKEEGWQKQKQLEMTTKELHENKKMTTMQQHLTICATLDRKLALS